MAPSGVNAVAVAQLCPGVSGSAVIVPPAELLSCTHRNPRSECALSGLACASPMITEPSVLAAKASLIGPPPGRNPRLIGGPPLSQRTASQYVAQPSLYGLL